MLDLTDRKNVFYWQTDRDLSAEDYKRIFLQRHQVPDDELVRILRSGITSIPVRDLTITPPDDNVLLGNVNVVRKVTINGKRYIVRMHPAEVNNGYFFVEKAALDLAAQHNIPVPRILEVHESTSADDMDFVLMTQSSGITMTTYIREHPADEEVLLHDCGLVMARIHDIRVERFGAFRNDVAKRESKLSGHHSTYTSFIHAGLSENLQRLVQFHILGQSQADMLQSVFDDTSFEPFDGPRLVHNDFADWNLLVDGPHVSAVLDWDECHGGDPVADLACWSTFFDLPRMQAFLTGYTAHATLPDDYEARFDYYRLRYTISKMALRAKRYQVDQSAFVKDKLEVGKRALEKALDRLA